MPIFAPKRRPAFKPLNKLRNNPFGAGKKGLLMGLNLTAMVDMFTVIVIFLLQSFSASGELMFQQKDLKLPEAEEAPALSERGPVVTLFENRILWEGSEVASLAQLDDAEPGIPALVERLKGVREREEKLFSKTAKAGEPFEGHIVVQADIKTDFKLVRKAIFSANEAGWVHIQFATMGGASAEGEGEGEEGEAAEG